MSSPLITALIAVVLFSVLMWLYVREFTVLSKTLELKSLVIGSMLVGVGIAGLLLWRWRERFRPLNVHFPGVVLILVFSIVFAPFFGSLLNRTLGSRKMQSFEFVSETAYYASGYGILKGEKLKPTGWKLTVREGRQLRRLKYKSQAYYPNTKPGEPVLLPVCEGLFGARVVELK